MLCNCESLRVLLAKLGLSGQRQQVSGEIIGQQYGGSAICNVSVAE